MTNIICPYCKGEGCVVCGRGGSVDENKLQERIEKLRKEGNLPENFNEEVK